jgi:hypothetical protein
MLTALPSMVGTGFYSGFMHSHCDPVVYSTQIVYVLFSDDLLVMFEGLRTPSAEQARLSQTH